ncbi:Ig-like domain-containing protein [Oscillospiraceae bacterium PP1C4]
MLKLKKVIALLMALTFVCTESLFLVVAYTEGEPDVSVQSEAAGVQAKTSSNCFDGEEVRIDGKTYRLFDNLEKGEKLEGDGVQSEAGDTENEPPVIDAELEARIQALTDDFMNVEGALTIRQPEDIFVDFGTPVTEFVLPEYLMAEDAEGREVVLLVQEWKQLDGKPSEASSSNASSSDASSSDASSSDASSSDASSSDASSSDASSSDASSSDASSSDASSSDASSSDASSSDASSSDASSSDASSSDAGSSKESSSEASSSTASQSEQITAETAQSEGTQQSNETETLVNTEEEKAQEQIYTFIPILEKCVYEIDSTSMPVLTVHAAATPTQQSASRISLASFGAESSGYDLGDSSSTMQFTYDTLSNAMGIQYRTGTGEYNSLFRDIDIYDARTGKQNKFLSSGFALSYKNASGKLIDIRTPCATIGIENNNRVYFPDPGLKTAIDDNTYLVAWNFGDFRLDILYHYINGSRSFSKEYRLEAHSKMSGIQLMECMDTNNSAQYWNQNMYRAYVGDSIFSISPVTPVSAYQGGLFGDYFFKVFTNYTPDSTFSNSMNVGPAFGLKWITGTLSSGSTASYKYNGFVSASNGSQDIAVVSPAMQEIDTTEAAKTATFSFDVVNLSSVSRTLTLSASTDSSSVKTSIGTSQVTIAPGGSTTVMVQATAPKSSPTHKANIYLKASDGSVSGQGVASLSVKTVTIGENEAPNLTLSVLSENQPVMEYDSDYLYNLYVDKFPATLILTATDKEGLVVNNGFSSKDNTKLYSTTITGREPAGSESPTKIVYSITVDNPTASPLNLKIEDIKVLDSAGGKWIWWEAGYYLNVKLKEKNPPTARGLWYQSPNPGQGYPANSWFFMMDSRNTFDPPSGYGRVMVDGLKDDSFVRHVLYSFYNRGSSEPFKKLEDYSFSGVNVDFDIYGDVRATVYDRFGNTTTTSSEFKQMDGTPLPLQGQLNIDKTAPDIKSLLATKALDGGLPIDLNQTYNYLQLTPDITDSASGIAKIEVISGNTVLKTVEPVGAPLTYNEPIEDIQAMGLQTIQLRVTDVAGNVAVSKDKIVIRMDSLPPVLRITGYDGKWTNKDIHLLIDSETAIASKLNYTQKESATEDWTKIGGPVNWNEQISYDIKKDMDTVYDFKAVSESNRENAKSFRIRRDTVIPPQAEITVGGDTGTNGWYISVLDPGKLQVSTTVQEAKIGESPNRVEYSLTKSGDTEKEMVAVDGLLPEITKDGIYSLRVQSKDEAGNVNTPLTMELRRDTAPPVVNKVDLAVDTTRETLNEISFGALFNDMVKVSIDANDETSGIAYYLVKLVDAVGDTIPDGAATEESGWERHTKPFYIEKDYKGAVLVKAVDQAGHVSALYAKTMLTELTPPTVPNITASTEYGTYTSGEWVNKPVTIRIADSTALSGMYAYDYYETPNDTPTRSTAFPTEKQYAASVQTDITAYALSNAGNKSGASDVFMLRCDLDSPVISVQSPLAPGMWTNQALPLQLQTQVGISGIAKVTVQRGTVKDSVFTPEAGFVPLDLTRGMAKGITQGQFTDYTSAFFADENGVYRITVRNNAGTEVNYDYPVTCIDKVKPRQTTMHITPESPNGQENWYVTNPTIRFDTNVVDVDGIAEGRSPVNVWYQLNKDGAQGAPTRLGATIIGSSYDGNNLPALGKDNNNNCDIIPKVKFTGNMDAYESGAGSVDAPVITDTVTTAMGVSGSVGYQESAKVSYSGPGTAIGTPAQLQSFINTPYSGGTFYLTADINLTGVPLNPRGKGNIQFYGNGRTVTGLSQVMFGYLNLNSLVRDIVLESPKIDNVYQFGLDGRVYGIITRTLENTSQIVNCKINGATFTDQGSLTDRSNLAFVSGLTGAGTKITNCTVSGSTLIASSNNGVSNNIGGITGSCGAEISNCEVINSTINAAGSRNVGMIAGSTYTKINNCLVQGGGITNALYAGGAVGNSSNNIVGCTVKDISVSGSSYVGGLVGEINTGSISGCIVTNANVSGLSYVGGLTGSSTIGIANCAVTNGSVTATGAGSYIGGFAGTLTGTGTYTNNVTSANVNAPLASKVGGFAGQLDTRNVFTVNKSSGNVKGGDQVGGFVGSMTATAAVTHCQALGDVEGTSNVGGFVGSAVNCIPLSRCSASGNVTGSDSVGGLAGVLTNTNLSQMSAQNNTVKGGGNTGGLVGKLTGSSSLSNLATAAAVSGTGNVGGLVGNATNTSSVGNCIYKGSGVTATGAYVGGAVGQSNTTGTLQNITVSGSVSGGDYTGGIVGSVTNTAIQYAVYKSGSVSGGSNVGGFIGALTGGSIYRCGANIAQTTGGSNVGGFVGNNQGIIAYASTHISGAITASADQAGGFVGQNLGNISSANVSVSNISAQNDAGGFVGEMTNGSLSSCASLVSGTVSANMSGGFAGRISGGVVAFAQADTPTVSGGGVCGGFAGENYLGKTDITLNSDGVYEIIYWAQDTATNLGDSASASVKVDITSAKASTLTLLDSSDALIASYCSALTNVTYPSFYDYVRASVQAVDATSGVESITYDLVSTTSETPTLAMGSSKKNVASDNVHFIAPANFQGIVLVQIMDHAGNVHTISSNGLNLTTSTGTTSATVVPGVDGWYKNAPTISINTSIVGGLVIANHQVSIDGVAWMNIGGTTYKPTASGDFSFRARFTDNSYSVPSVSLPVLLDTQGPELSLSARSAVTGNLYRDSAMLSIIAADAGSGVAVTEYSIDGINFVATNGQAQISAPFNGDVTVCATDRVGNVTKKTIALIVDNIYPTVKLSAKDSEQVPYIPGTYGDTAKPVTVTVADNNSTLSGVDHYEVRLDGGAWQKIIGNTVLVEKVGNTTVEVRAVSKVDMVGPTSKIVISLENRSGEIGFTAAANPVWTNHSRAIVITPANSVGFAQKIVYEVLENGSWVAVPLSNSYMADKEGIVNWSLRARTEDSSVITTRSATTYVDKTAPGDTKASATATLTNGWYKELPTITVQRPAWVNNTSPENTDYALFTDMRTALEPLVGDKISISSDGSYTLLLRTKDEAGNIGSTTTYTVAVDTIAPVMQEPVEGFGAGLKKLFSQPFTVKLRASDVGSGVERYEYQLINGTEDPAQDAWVTGDSITIPSSFNGVLYARAYDVAGNKSAIDSYAYLVDSTAPEAPIITVVDPLPPLAQEQWYAQDVTVHITYNGVVPLAGIKGLEYSLDGTWLPLPEDGNVTVTTEGLNRIFARAVTNTEVAGQISYQNLRIDKTVPSFTLHSNAETWINGTAEVTVTPTSTVRSPVTYYYSMDDGASYQKLDAVGTLKLSIVDDYNGRVLVFAKNEAGTSSTASSVNVKLDNTSPANASFTAQGTISDDAWFRDTPAISIQPPQADSGSPITTYYRPIGDETANWVEYDGSNAPVIPANVDGMHAIAYKTVDDAGNESAVKYLNMQVDRTPPTVEDITYHLPDEETSLNPLLDSLGFYQQEIGITINAKDDASGSGLINLKYYFSNSAKPLESPTWMTEDLRLKTSATVYQRRDFTGYLHYVVYDKAGNASAEQVSGYLNISTKKPIITVTAITSPVYRDWFKTQAVLTADILEKNSGLKSVAVLYNGETVYQKAYPTPQNEGEIVTAQQLGISVVQNGEGRTQVITVSDGVQDFVHNDNTPTDSGRYEFTIQATNYNGNSESTLYCVYVDGCVPATPIVTHKLGDANGENYTVGTWTNASIDALIADDPRLQTLSGIKSFEVSISQDNTEWSAWAPINTPLEAQHLINNQINSNAYYKFRSVSMVGIEGSESPAYHCMVDAQKPDISAVAVSNLNARVWAKKAPIITVTPPTDEAQRTQSPVSTYYRFGTKGAETTPVVYSAGNAPIVTQPGEYQINTFARDEAGNASENPDKFFLFGYDNTLPLFTQVLAGSDATMRLIREGTRMRLEVLATDTFSGAMQADYLLYDRTGKKMEPKITTDVTKGNGADAYMFTIPLDDPAVTRFQLKSITDAADNTLDINSPALTVIMGKVEERNGDGTISPKKDWEIQFKDKDGNTHTTTLDDKGEYQILLPDDNYDVLIKNDSDPDGGPLAIGEVVVGEEIGGNLYDEQTRHVDYLIDRVTPILTVKTSGVIGAWTNQDVTFTLGNDAVFADRVPYAYYVRIDNGEYVPLNGVPGWDATNRTLTLNDTNVHTYHFKIITEKGLTNESNAYDVKLDKVVPTVDSMLTTDGFKSKETLGVKDATVNGVFYNKPTKVTVHTPDADVVEFSYCFVETEDANYLLSGTETFTKVNAAQSITVNIAENFRGKLFVKVQDRAGNVSSVYEAYFTVDQIRPTVVRIEPADESVNVGIADAFTIEYSERMKMGGGSIKLYRKSNKQLLDELSSSNRRAKLSADCKTVTFTLPYLLEHSTDYYLVVDDDFAVDWAENTLETPFGISKDKEWRFSTVEGKPIPDENIHLHEFEVYRIFDENTFKRVYSTIVPNMEKTQSLTLLRSADEVRLSIKPIFDSKPSELTVTVVEGNVQTQLDEKEQAILATFPKGQTGRAVIKITLGKSANTFTFIVNFLDPEIKVVVEDELHLDANVDENMLVSLIDPPADADKILLEVIIANVEHGDATPDEIANLRNAAGRRAALMDISLLMTTESGGKQTKQKLTNLQEKLRITLNILPELKGASEYKILRMHRGEINNLRFTNDSNAATFYSDRFSLFAIAVVDTPSTDSDEEIVPESKPEPHKKKVVDTSSSSADRPIQNTQPEPSDGGDKADKEESAQAVNADKSPDKVLVDEVSGKVSGKWSLINLLCTLLVIGMEIVTLLRRRKTLLNILPGTILAIVSVILLLCTQTFSSPMVLWDAWSVLFLILGLASVISCLFLRNHDKKKEDDETAQASD